MTVYLKKKEVIFDLFLSKSEQLTKLKEECERFSNENQIYKTNLSQIQVKLLYFLTLRYDDKF